jgi:hypothetical protein
MVFVIDASPVQREKTSSPILEKMPDLDLINEALDENGILDGAKFFSKSMGFLKVADLLSFIQVKCKKRLTAVKFDGVQVVDEIQPEHFLHYIPVSANIISCKRVITARSILEYPKAYYTGILEVNSDRFRYISFSKLPTGRLKLVVYPVMYEWKKKVIPILEVLAVEKPPEPQASITPHNLDDLRALYTMLVGEDVNVKLALLALASRLNLNRDFWVMGIVVQGESSAGKSYFVDNVLQPFRLLKRVEEFTRFTGAFLERKFRGRNMDECILTIYELFENTPQQLHLTLSEGRLRVGIVDRETGEPVEYEFEGQPFLFSTTPLEGLRPDLRNRLIVTSVDETDEQTNRIIEFQTRLAADAELAAALKQKQAEGAEAVAAWFKSLKPAYVAVPWAEKLREAVTFSSVKLRRDWRKFIALIQASALLFQHERQTFEKDGKRFVVADRRDFENVLSVMPAFKQTLQNVTETQRLILDVMDSNLTWTTSELTKVVNAKGRSMSSKRVRRILEELEELGYVVVTRNPGKENIYEKVGGYREVDFNRLLDIIPVLEQAKGLEQLEQVGTGLEHQPVLAQEAVEAGNFEESRGVGTQETHTDAPSKERGGEESESEEKVKNEVESSGFEYYGNTEKDVSEGAAACPTPLENPEFQGPTPPNPEKAECSNPIPGVFQRSNPEVSLKCAFGLHENCPGKFPSLKIDWEKKMTYPTIIPCQCTCHASNTAPEMT